MPIAYLCDFDGTISPCDIGAAFAERFSPSGAASKLPMLDEWLAGRVGHRDLTQAQCGLLSVTEEDARAFTRTFSLDPHFAPFAREALGRGDAVMVVSEGLGFYVQDHLERAGLGELPWAANLAVFHEGRVAAEFPYSDPACESCGNCKAQHVRRYRGRGFHTVMVGDGASDRHGALAADSVLAKDSLLQWCEREGIAYKPFEDFRDVAEFARRLDPMIAPTRPARRVGR
ncbi:MAG: HAD-IB family phosphatase [Candidatus Eisenbacteria bacterium]